RTPVLLRRGGVPRVRDRPGDAHDLVVVPHLVVEAGTDRTGAGRSGPPPAPRGSRDAPRPPSPVLQGPGRVLPREARGPHTRRRRRRLRGDRRRRTVVLPGPRAATRALDDRRGNAAARGLRRLRRSEERRVGKAWSAA